MMQKQPHSLALWCNAGKRGQTWDGGELELEVGQDCSKEVRRLQQVHHERCFRSSAPMAYPRSARGSESA